MNETQIFVSCGTENNHYFVLLFPRFADQVFIDHLGKPSGSLAITIKNLVYSELGLTSDFRFHGMIFSGGMEDVRRLTSPPQSGRMLQKLFTGPARLRKGNIDYTAARFERERLEYAEVLAKTFNSVVLDTGVGFPAHGALVKQSSFFEVDRADENTAKALVGFFRERLSQRLGAMEAGRLFPDSGVGVVPFPMPFHQTGPYWTPTEQSIGRLAMHVLNCVHLFLQEWRIATHGFHLCPGTPGYAFEVPFVSSRNSETETEKTLIAPSFHPSLVHRYTLSDVTSIGDGWMQRFRREIRAWSPWEEHSHHVCRHLGMGPPCPGPVAAGLGQPRDLYLGVPVSVAVIFLLVVHSSFQLVSQT